MLPVFENVIDVIEFLVHHFPVGFQTIEERLHALDVVKAANPLTADRKAAEEARIAAERQKDTGRTDTAVYNTPANSGFTQADVDAAAAKAAEAAIAAYIASQNAPKTVQAEGPNTFSVTPSFVPEPNPGN